MQCQKIVRPSGNLAWVVVTIDLLTRLFQLLSEALRKQEFQDFFQLSSEALCKTERISLSK
jgi:hypothetical protein